MVKFAEDAPPLTNTELGTLAAPLLLDRLIVAPPAGAALVRVTVAVEVCPPITLPGAAVREARETTCNVWLVMMAEFLSVPYCVLAPLITQPT
jgi:hypothetical protein